MSGGAIAGIVVPTLIVIGLLIFLIVKKDEWVPKMKASPVYKNLRNCLSCELVRRKIRERRRTRTQRRTRAQNRRSNAVSTTSAPAVVVNLVVQDHTYIHYMWAMHVSSCL